MNFEELIDDDGNKHIVIDNGNGGFTGFPAENSNSNFISFMRGLEKTNDPYYLAWVEAGNDPDEFWSQSEDFLTLSESNETEAI